MSSRVLIPVLRSLGIATALALASQSVLAQAPALTPNFEPQVGQAGKDVIWVPTPPELIETMMKAANVGPNDLVVDLGSGDGVGSYKTRLARP